MKGKMKVASCFVLLLIFLFTLVNSASALTGSIGNARMILYPEVGFWGTTVEKSILVKNVNNVSVNISLEISEELKDIVKLIDKKFILKQGEEKKAYFDIKLKKPGDYSGKINIFFKPLEGEKTGVALASTIIIHAIKKGSAKVAEETDLPDENEDNSSIKNNTGLTGNVVAGNEKSGKTIYLLAIPTIILVGLFIFLVYKVSKIKKRRDRSS